jgi:hypothetical protein
LDEVWNYTWSLIFENGKLGNFNWSFKEEADYRVSVFNWSLGLNNIELIRLDKKNKDFKFLNNVSVENIWGRKNIWNDEVRFIYKDKEYSLKLK